MTSLSDSVGSVQSGEEEEEDSPGQLHSIVNTVAAMGKQNKENARMLKILSFRERCFHCSRSACQESCGTLSSGGS